MRVQRLLVAVSTSLIIVAPVEAAQENPYGGGTRLTGTPPAEIPTEQMSNDDRARITTERLAACLMKDRRPSVLKAIEPEPWEAGARKMLGSVADARCLEEGELAIPPDVLRGAFYQAIYRETFASVLPTLPPTPINFAGPSGASLTDDAKTEIAVRQFGDCVARRDLQNAHLLVMSEPGSAQENSALGALSPHFSACVVQGSKWTLSRSILTSILSEVLYREGIEARRAGKQENTVAR